MTRTATKPGRAKRALDATPWEELSAGSKNTAAKRPNKPKATASPSVSKDAINHRGASGPTKKDLVKIRKSESRRLKRIHFRHSDKVSRPSH